MLGTKLLGWPWLGVWVLMIIGPSLWSYYRDIESSAFPVVVEMQALKVEEHNGFIIVSGTANKLRDCTIQAIIARKDGVQLGMLFERGNTYRKHLKGSDLPFGPWRVYGTSTLKGVEFTFVHRCHYAWNTISRFIF